MNAMNFLSAMIFSPGQLALCILIGILLAGLIALNIVFAVIYRVKAERKLRDERLEKQRRALLDKLEYLKSGGEVETHSWLDYVVDDEDDEEEPGKKYVTVRMAVGEQPANAQILAVDDMSPRMRRKLGFRAKRHNGKRFYVRYSLGFDARLRYSSDEVKARYIEFMNTVKSYAGVSVVNKFGSRCICVGKDVIAMILFGGKRMCVAFALDPATYEKTKYRGEDKSDKKRFAKTPLLIRVSSDEKLETILYLFEQLATSRGLEKVVKKKPKYDLTERSQEDMIVSGSVRVIILDEVPNIVQTRATHVVASESPHRNSVPEETDEVPVESEIQAEAAAAKS